MEKDDTEGTNKMDFIEIQIYIMSIATVFLRRI